MVQPAFSSFITLATISYIWKHVHDKNSCAYIMDSQVLKHWKSDNQEDESKLNKHHNYYAACI